MWALHNCLSRAVDCWKTIAAQVKQHHQQHQQQEEEEGGQQIIHLLPPWLLPAQRDAVADVLSACSDEPLQHTVVQVRRGWLLQDQASMSALWTRHAWAGWAWHTGHGGCYQQTTKHCTARRPVPPGWLAHKSSEWLMVDSITGCWR